jgi:phage terminase small subunit
MTELTPKQEAFCLRYLETGNASEAYRLSYDADGMATATVNRKAKELLDNGKIAARLEMLRARHMKRHDVTVERVLAEYAKLAFVDIRNAFDADGILKPIHELDDATAAAISGLEVDKKVSKFTDENGEPMVESHLHKIKLSDKRAALDSLAKYLKMFSDNAVNVNVHMTATKEQRDAAVAAALGADA